MPRLPQELIEAIVDEVEGKETLQACSLTSTSLVATSQRNLFRRMSLCWDSPNRCANVLDRALSFLRNLPHLGRYVRDVTLVIPGSIEDQTTLARILPMLGSAERLAINGDAKNWDYIPVLESAICSTISLPFLKKLHLFRINDIPSSVLYHAASSVRTLSLNLVLPRMYDTSPDKGLFPRLETLILPWYLGLQPLLRSNNFLLMAQNLRRLVMPLHGSDHHCILVASSASHLQQLEFNCGAFSIPLDLPHLPALSSMTLTILRSQNVNEPLPGSLSAVIETLPAVAPGIKKLILEIQLTPREREQLWHDHKTFPVFDSPSYCQSLSHLREIHCRLAYSDPSMTCVGRSFEDALVGFVEMMQSKLPAPHADDILTFGRGIHRARFNHLDEMP